MTITETIKYVMRAHGAPMSTEDAYRAIIEAKLYEFHADDPVGIVRNQIRRHCEGLDFPSASPTKHFRLVGDSRYEALAEIVRGQRKLRSLKAEPRKPTVPVAKGPLTC